MAVNKIQMVLSQCLDEAALLDIIDEAIQTLQGEEGVNTPEHYKARYFKPNRYDPPEIQYVKKMLQTGLSEQFRSAIVDSLFTKWVSGDEESIAAEFYLQPDQLREMIDSGQYVGPHGVHHNWINHLTVEKMKSEIAENLSFMVDIGAVTENWVACYPYGGTQTI